MRGKGLLSSLKWLYPGMRVKRWLLLIPVGLLLAILGVVLLVDMRIVDLLGIIGTGAFRWFGLQLTVPATKIPVGSGLVALGLLLIFVSLRQVVRSITSVVSPEAEGKLADVVFQRRYLAQGQRIVVIGGGTGLSTMLRGLKQYSSNLVAIVTVTDDGGSSGRLQREMGMLPPGDIRNCLVALADEEPLMTELFQYRFGDGIDGLDGHSFGNLLIAAMTRITGDFERAVKETSNILAIRGRVLPSTIENVRLQAELEDGTLAEGETNIVKAPQAIKHIMLHPSSVEPLEETLKAIELADCIVMGPGSVYTSVVPNLLVNGIAEAIAEVRCGEGLCLQRHDPAGRNRRLHGVRPRQGHNEALRAACIPVRAGEPKEAEQGHAGKIRQPGPDIRRARRDHNPGSGVQADRRRLHQPDRCRPPRPGEACSGDFQAALLVGPVSVLATTCIRKANAEVPLSNQSIWSERRFQLAAI